MARACLWHRGWLRWCRSATSVAAVAVFRGGAHGHCRARIEHVRNQCTCGAVVCSAAGSQVKRVSVSGRCQRSQPRERACEAGMALYQRRARVGPTTSMGFVMSVHERGWHRHFLGGYPRKSSRPAAAAPESVAACSSRPATMSPSAVVTVWLFPSGHRSLSLMTCSFCNGRDTFNILLFCCILYSSCGG